MQLLQHSTDTVGGFATGPDRLGTFHVRLCICCLQAVWALGNIAGDSPQCRNLVLQAGALPPLLEQLGDNQKVSMQRNATWTLSNFCRGKPPPDFSVVSATMLSAL